MAAVSHFWIRHETRTTERRAPIAPEEVRTLVSAGHSVTAERCERRVFADGEYADAGASLAEPGSWVDAPDAAVIVGIKELPAEPAELRHTHLFFGHAYKGQDGAVELLERFRRGGGRLLDVEYLTEGGRRVVAFGYWAGYVGAALGVLQLRGMLPAPVAPMERQVLDRMLAEGVDHTTRALVTGARGRSGTGASDALTTAGMTVTGWDVEETRDLDVETLLSHELLVNCVVATTPQTPFVTADGLGTQGRELRVVADVTCDVTSDLNLAPVNTSITSWDAPARRVHVGDGGEHPLDVIAIDNLPSLLPLEASRTFSADLLPQLLALDSGSEAWESTQRSFDEAISRLP